MKNHVLLLLLLLLAVGWSAHGQIAYHDAIKIKNNLNDQGEHDDPDRLKNTYNILSAYHEKDNPTDSEILTTFSDNPFIAPVLPEGAGAGVERFAGTAATKALSSLSGIGGLDVTRLADGIALFLVERTKQELNIAFFQRFKTVISDYPEFKALFPKTSGFMSMIEAYNYSSMLQVLKEAFEADLVNLAGNLQNLRNPDACPKGKSECRDRLGALAQFFKTENGNLLIFSSLFTDRLIKGENVAEALDEAVTETMDEPVLKQSNTYNGVKALRLFSQSLRNNDTDRIWVSRDGIKNLSKDILTLRLYLGLIYQQSKKQDIRFNIAAMDTPVTFSQILDALEDDLDQVEKLMEQIGSVLGKIDQQLINIRKIKESKESLSLAQVEEYLNAIKGLISLEQNIIHIIPKNLVDSAKLEALNQRVKNFVTASGYGLEMVGDAQARNYAAMIFDVTLLLEKLFPEQGFPFKDKLVKYGVFIATVAQAETSEEIHQAIEVVALPVGSASIKRRSAVNVALNAYVGPFIGEEKLQSGGYSIVTGITSPVGVNVSWGGWDSFIGGFTLFTSIIDVGALTTYRFNDDNVEELPKVTFQNILAPGAHVYLNMRDLPLSAGFGYQVGPTLRKVEDVGSSVGERSVAYRWQITLAVDIPIVNFYTKTK